MNSNKIIKVNRKLAILKQKEENELLETETKEIEKRLNLLKSTLYSEICKKSNASDSEPIWKSSHSSFTVNKPKSDALIDVSKIKFKTLKHNPLSKNKPPDVFGDVIRKIADLNKKVPGCSTDHGQLQCGQCEDKRAVVSCQECSEYYCAKCFASFHMKGALRRHHSLPISTSTPRFESLQSKHFNESSQSTSCEKAVSIGCQSSFGASDKLNAELQTEDTKTMKQNQFFDNKQSLTLSKRSSTPVVGCNVSTLCRSPVPIEIHFTPSISYAEKLLLRLHRNSKLQQLGSQISTNHQTMSMEMIQGQSNSEEHTMQDFKLDRISFNELHKLATSEVQLNGTLALYPTNDLEPSTPQLNEIMSSGGDEFNYNRLHENLVCHQTFLTLTDQTENTEVFQSVQYSKTNSRDETNGEQNRISIINSSNSQQDIWQPERSIFSSDSFLDLQLNKHVIKYLNMISDEKSLNTTDTLDKFDEESKNTIRSTILQQLTPSMDHHQVTKIGKEVVDIRGEERDDDEDDDEHNYLYDSLG